MAASTRGFLVSWRVYVAYVVVVLLVDVVFSTDLRSIDWSPFVVVPGLIALWWFNRRNAVWVERDAAGIRVQTRRGWKWEDLSSGRLRLAGEVVADFPVGTHITYDPDAIAWWRADRTLIIDGRRFAVHPEGHKLAISLANEAQWQSVGHAR